VLQTIIRDKPADPYAVMSNLFKSRRSEIGESQKPQDKKQMPDGSSQKPGAAAELHRLSKKEIVAPKADPAMNVDLKQVHDAQGSGSQESVVAKIDKELKVKHDQRSSSHETVAAMLDPKQEVVSNAWQTAAESFSQEAKSNAKNSSASDDCEKTEDAVVQKIEQAPQNPGPKHKATSAYLQEPQVRFQNEAQMMQAAEEKKHAVEEKMPPVRGVHAGPKDDPPMKQTKPEDAKAGHEDSGELAGGAQDGEDPHASKLRTKERLHSLHGMAGDLILLFQEGLLQKVVTDMQEHCAQGTAESKTQIELQSSSIAQNKNKPTQMKFFANMFKSTASNEGLCGHVKSLVKDRTDASTDIKGRTDMPTSDHSADVSYSGGEVDQWMFREDIRQSVQRSYQSGKLKQLAEDVNKANP